ncbi:mitogen-activated protein kinase tyrosine protein phosphatase sdp1 [Cymbomonas tetramitiformis]|uniref:Mitogen-activated protein kinase tyrosine protein phosphatase sdp1 n=1 Tax=Cymbomonas tetramitiformis TaxID=36881 RepID=A0AAE0GYT1_9CHLO|nr:mitogen-activated protein kinase tyrosine protein phosphatase sdp1 [Cymbomonas tetramitiformis]
MLLCVTAVGALAQRGTRVKDFMFCNMEINAMHPKEIESSTNSSCSKDHSVGPARLQAAKFSCLEPFRCLIGKQPIDLLTKRSVVVTTTGLGAIAGGGLLATLLILSSRNRAKLQRELPLQVAGMKFRSDKRRIVGSFEETFPWTILEIVFAPCAIWSQVKLICWLRFAYSAFFNGSEALAELGIGQLLKRDVGVQSACTYDEWRSAQLQLDEKQHLEAPKALSFQPAQDAGSIEKSSEEEFEDSLEDDGYAEHNRL